MDIYVRIIKCDGTEWYKDHIGEVFKVHSESRKGGRGKWVVRFTKKQRNQKDKYMGGYPYGWVSKEHCEIIKKCNY